MYASSGERQPRFWLTGARTGQPSIADAMHELDFIKLGLARQVAEAMGARYLKLEDLRADSLADAVRLQLPNGEPPALNSPPLTSEDARSMVRKLKLT